MNVHKGNEIFKAIYLDFNVRLESLAYKCKFDLNNLFNLD